MNRALLLAALIGMSALAGAEEPKRCADIADSAARLACYDAQATPTPAPVPAPTPAPVPPPAPEEPASITSVDGRIVGTFKGWHKGQIFTLDNGQTWKVDDGAEQYYADLPDNPKVSIARGYLGGYWMTIEHVDRKVKVRRVMELRKKK